MVHADTAPVLDRNITEPLPSVQEEDMPHSPLMTPKASAEAKAEAEPQDQDEDVEGTTAPEELDEIRDEGWLS